MVFIDGSHVYEDVVADFNGFFPHLLPGGILAVHDVGDGHPGVWKAWREHMSHCLCETGMVGNLAFGRKGKEQPGSSGSV